MTDVEIIDADVLVIGGGFAGAWAALRAAEHGGRVVLLEKAYVSRSGASTMSGGVTSCPQDSDDLDAWAAEFIARGGYTSDQRWTRQLLSGQRDRVKDLERWGIPISRDDDGRIRRFLSRGMVEARCMQYSPKAAIEELRRQIVARGVTILDRWYVTELLTEDGEWPTRSRVIGAVGFNVRSGSFAVFRAKQTILCTGMIGMKVGIHLVDNDTGDGAGMAYRAGANLVDLEFMFGGTFSIGEKQFKLAGYNVAIAHGAWLINSLGERFMERYDPVRLERGELPLVIAAFAREIIEGRGPCYLDHRRCDESYWHDVERLGRSSKVLVSGALPDPKTYPTLIEPCWGLWTSDGRGGIGIDIDCRTNVPGLLAAGACAKNFAIGTHGSAGSPTAFSMVSGWIAGDRAGRSCRDVDPPVVPTETVRALRDRTFAPLARKAGAQPDHLHDALAKFEESLIDTIALNADKLERRIEAIHAVHLDALNGRADNLHELVKLFEARNLAEVSEMTYRSALDRTESREQFYREDFPYTDDDGWLCWHGVRSIGGGPVFARTPIPFHPGDIRPSSKYRGLGPMAAIMQGSYDPAAYDHRLRKAERVGEVPA